MQQPKRFQAPTLGEAYAMVRAELGGDAVILSTRKASAPGLFGRPGRQFVEVVAHLPEANVEPRAGRRPSFEQDMAAHELVRGVAEAAAVGMAIDPAVELAPPFENAAAGRMRNIDPPLPTPAEAPFESPAATFAGPFSALNEHAAEPAAPMAPAPAEAAPLPVAPTLAAPVTPVTPVDAVAAALAPEPQPAASSSLADRALIATLARQLTEVRTMLDQLVADRVNERVEQGPPGLKEIHELLLRQGLSQAVLSPLLAQVSDSLVRGSDREAALRTVERKLAARMPQAARVDLGRRPTAIFLVGPSGAGKTTMAIRLGLDIERAHGLRVVVAGTDVSRAGAPQQLMAFGAASGMDVRLCYAPAELKAILDDGVTDVVIVDTAGHNGTRRDRMAELNAFTQVARRRSVLLTLPATMKGVDVNDVVAAYSGSGIDGFAITRCDETSTFGAIANVAIDAQIGIAYTAHSDQVSDAARAGDHLALAGAVVTGRWAASSINRAQAAVASPTLARVG